MAPLDSDNVTFQYDERVQSLKGISFKVPAGKTYALVGSSGGGKTTIMRLVFRFYDVRTGRILIDGAVSQPPSLAPRHRADQGRC